MICNNCSKTIDDDSDFCCFCGADCVKKCPTCGTINVMAANFCKKCRTKLSDDFEEPNIPQENVTEEVPSVLDIDADDDSLDIFIHSDFSSSEPASAEAAPASSASEAAVGNSLFTKVAYDAVESKSADGKLSFSIEEYFDKPWARDIKKIYIKDGVSSVCFENLFSHESCLLSDAELYIPSSVKTLSLSGIKGIKTIVVNAEGNIEISLPYEKTDCELIINADNTDILFDNGTCRALIIQGEGNTLRLSMHSEDLDYFECTDPKTQMLNLLHFHFANISVIDLNVAQGFEKSLKDNNTGLTVRNNYISDGKQAVIINSEYFYGRYNNAKKIGYYSKTQHKILSREESRNENESDIISFQIPFTVGELRLRDEYYTQFGPEAVIALREKVEKNYTQKHDAYKDCAIDGWLGYDGNSDPYKRNQSQNIPCIIAEGTKWIGAYAFYKQVCISEIAFPESLERIEGHSFPCSFGKDIKLSFPKSLRSIGEFAFEFCPYIKEIEFSNGIEELGDHCFDSCSGFEELVLPETVKKIGNSAFAHSVSGDSFEKGFCKLVDIDFDEYRKPSLKRAEIKSGDIGSEAFKNHSALETLVLGNKVTSIGREAFAGCTSLKKVFIPASVKEIDMSAFEYCTSLEIIEFEEGFNGKVTGHFNYNHRISSVSLIFPRSLNIKKLDIVIGKAAYAKVPCEMLTKTGKVPKIFAAVSKVDVY